MDWSFPAGCGFSRSGMGYIWQMRSLKNIVWLIICLISYLLAIWICVVNIQEIADRVMGHYTFFSQRASLGDGEAILYCGVWTLVFVILLFLSIRHLGKKENRRAGIYAVILILLFILSDFVDTLFYYPLV